MITIKVTANSKINHRILSWVKEIILVKQQHQFKTILDKDRERNKQVQLMLKIYNKIARLLLQLSLKLLQQ
jgi:hypothetical protein